MFIESYRTEDARSCMPHELQLFLTLKNKKAPLTPRSARDSSAAWWIGIQYRQWLKWRFFHTPLVFGAAAPYLPVGISGCRFAWGN